MRPTERKASWWRGRWRGAAILLICLAWIPQCRLDGTLHREKYVSVKLNDSLSKYDSVEILILAADDTSKVVGKVWEGPLAHPDAIPDFRLDDNEERTLAIRVRAFDGSGTLVLDMLITKDGDKQTVKDLPLPAKTPPPALSLLLISLTVSAGTLSPAFDSSINNYQLNVPRETSSLIVTAVAASDKTALRIGSADAVSGKPSDPIDLKTGNNVITVNVSSDQAGNSYSIKVIRTLAPP